MGPLNWDEFKSSIEQRAEIKGRQTQASRRIFALLRAVGVSNHTANEIAKEIGIILSTEKSDTKQEIRA